jgi:hypothetical protein
MTTELMTLPRLLEVYTEQNWEILTFKSEEVIHYAVKPNLADSFGTALPVLSPGTLFHFPIQNMDGSHLLYAFSSIPTANLLATKTEDIYKTLQAVTMHEEIAFNDADEVATLIEKARKEYGSSMQVVGRVLVVEDDVVKCSVKFLFLIDNDLNIPYESIIVFDDDDKIVLLLSEEFKSQFQDNEQSLYLTNIILSSISFLLEYYKNETINNGSL